MLLARHGRLRRRNRKHRSILLLGVLLLASLVALLLATVAFTGQQLLTSQCNLSDLRALALGENSFLYTDNMQRLGVVPSATNRQKLPLSKISPSLPEATVAIEDARFWQHGALDYQGILRALYQNLSKGHIVQGGSTITQELVRNLYIGNPQRTLSRKVKEACLADEVLRAEHAQADPHRLPQRGLLRAARVRRAGGGADVLLQARLEADARPGGAARRPAAGAVGVRPAQEPARRAGPPERGAARDVEEPLHQQVQAAVGDAEEAPAQARSPLFGAAPAELLRLGDAAARRPGSSHRQVELGGLKVKTTLNMRLQGLALHAVSSVLHTPTDPAAAIVSIDPKTGAVKAMVDYLPSGQKMQFNLATQAHRSTGSSFKPITLATALSRGASLSSSFYGPPELLITDPACATNNGPWDVHNFADETAGTMSLLSATAYSVNTIFAQLISVVGVRNVQAMANHLGITEKADGPYFRRACAITLGSVGFTPLEMTDVYATFASGGVQHDPQAFEFIRGPNGKVIDRLSTKGTRVLSPNVAARLTYALQGVVQHGTGTAAALGARPVAGKTGTAEDFKDAWFCGYVPQLATCVWVGYPKGEISLYNVEGVGEVAGGTLPAAIWHAYMSGAVGSLPVENFPTPELHRCRHDHQRQRHVRLLGLLDAVTLDG